MSNAPEDTPADRRARRWLALGATAGLALAAASIVGERPDAGDLPPGAVARVGDAVIRTEEYQRLVAGLESDRREPVDGALRRHVLDRMIDEELLVQRAVELGLVDVDRRVRADLTTSMIQSIVDDAEEHDATARELERFYEANREFFASAGRLHVRQVFFRRGAATGPGGASADDGASPDARAARAAERLAAGEPFERVRDELGDAEISPLPDVLLPPLKLREYVGPTALRAAMELAPGGVSAPVRSGTGVHVLVLVEREDAHVPPFDEIEEQVRAEWRRRRGDDALRAYLDGLREDVDVIARDVEDDATWLELAHGSSGGTGR
ncbi:MAG: peptidylprolyl isomerase [Myxococcota bacterium]